MSVESTEAKETVAFITSKKRKLDNPRAPSGFDGLAPNKREALRRHLRHGYSYYAAGKMADVAPVAVHKYVSENQIPDVIPKLNRFSDLLPEERVRIASNISKGVRFIADEYDIPPPVVERWIKEGITKWGFEEEKTKPMGPKLLKFQDLTPEARLIITSRMHVGRPYQELADDLGLQRHLVYQWLEHKQVPGFRREENHPVSALILDEPLKRLVDLARMSNLTKLMFRNLSEQAQISIMAELQMGHTYCDVADDYGVHRSLMYQWLADDQIHGLKPIGDFAVDGKEDTLIVVKIEPTEKKIADILMEAKPLPLPKPDKWSIYSVYSGVHPLLQPRETRNKEAIVVNGPERPSADLTWTEVIRLYTEAARLMCPPDDRVNGLKHTELITIDEKDPRVGLRGGRGLAAKTKIKKGTLLGPYRGLLMTEDDLTHLMEFDPSVDLHAYAYSLDTDIDGQEVLVTAFGDYGDWTKYINDPIIVDGPEKQPEREKLANCEAVEIKYCGWPYIILMTTKDIKKGQELFLRYGVSYWKLRTKMERQVARKTTAADALKRARGLLQGQTRSDPILL